MTERAQLVTNCPWKTLFRGCRSAVRSSAGLEVAEFLFPLMILSMKCSSEASDEESILQELLGILECNFETSSDFIPGTSSDLYLRKRSSRQTSKLNGEDMERAVNAVLNARDTFQFWAYWKSSDDKPIAGLSHDICQETDKRLECKNEVWTKDHILRHIKELLLKIPVRVCARAATAVGMHARALRYLEVESRQLIVAQVFEEKEELLCRSTHVPLAMEIENKDDDHCRKGAGGCISPIPDTDLPLMRLLAGRLDDCDAMAAFADEASRIMISSNVTDSLAEQEIRNDWKSALLGYERSLQLLRAGTELEEKWRLESGMLRCLLELGQLETILNQITGLRCENFISNEYKCNKYPNHLLPYATEAAWRLGRWDLLNDLCEVSSGSREEKSSDDSDIRYHVAFSRALLAIHEQSNNTFHEAIQEARGSLLSSMSAAARETYSRCYPLFVRLQCIREVEEVGSAVLGTNGKAISVNDAEQMSNQHSILPPCDWDLRLSLISPDLKSFGSVVNTRVALSRFLSDNKSEGHLWLKYGKRARKQGQFHLAETALAHAQTALNRLDLHRDIKLLGSSELLQHLTDKNDVLLQLGKLKFQRGDCNAAIQLLEPVGFNPRALLDSSDEKLKHVVREIFAERDSTGTNKSAMNNNLLDSQQTCDLLFGSRLLQVTQWMTESGIKSGADIMDRYRLLVRISPNWEKGHLSFARYLDSLLEGRIVALGRRLVNELVSKDDEGIRMQVLQADAGCQRYLVEAMKFYGNGLCYGGKYVYEALPKLLQLWFELASIIPGSIDKAILNDIKKHQTEATSLMVLFSKKIPAHIYYSAIPQLVSRVNHQDNETQQIVKEVLTKVLSQYPEQTMWHLAWLLHSQHHARAEIGHEIFDGAQRVLHHEGRDQLHDLLVCSQGLFKWLVDLAKYQPKDSRAESISIRPWKGERPLEEFVPPVQAALSLTSSLKSDLGKGHINFIHDAFYSSVPRMRTFSAKIKVMLSKARPKRLTAYAIIPFQNMKSKVMSKTSSKPQPGDLGEIHFLVKQEAKGDLRKDARVQDLNNVVNRLFAADASRKNCRLHLRTFSVTCLSEETGILEWVPHTDSFRNIVASSTNPQASLKSIKREGERIAKFQDPKLRDCFLKCQEVYFKTGNLLLATTMYEENCLKCYPPVMYWWFIEKFLDPHAWYEARTKFALSSSAWSAIGHVIGLGDRHSENVLIDTNNGQCVHVDFDW